MATTMTGSTRQAAGTFLACLLLWSVHGETCLGSDQRSADPVTGLERRYRQEESDPELEHGILHAKALGRRQRIELGRAAFEARLRDQVGISQHWGEPEKNERLARAALDGVKCMARSYLRGRIDPLRRRIRSRMVGSRSVTREEPRNGFGLDLSTSLRLGRDPQIGARLRPSWQQSKAVSALELEIRKGLRSDLLALGLRWHHGRSRVWLGHRLRDDRHGREIELSVRIVF